MVSISSRARLGLQVIFGIDVPFWKWPFKISRLARSYRCAARPSVVSATLTVVPVLPPSLVPLSNRHAGGIVRSASTSADTFRRRACARRTSALRHCFVGSGS
jgi:hypothetical protein